MIIRCALRTSTTAGRQFLGCLTTSFLVVSLFVVVLFTILLHFSLYFSF